MDGPGRFGQNKKAESGDSAFCLMCGCLQPCFDGFRCLLVARLVQQGEHIFLVRLHAGLVERVYAEDVTADAAGASRRSRAANRWRVRRSAGISMRMLGTPPSTCASCTPSSAMRLTSEMRFPARKLRPSRFSAVGLDNHLVGGFGNRNDRLEQRAFAVLNVLSHRVQVGRQRDAGREDALALLAFALAVELFPPLVDVLQLRLVGAEDLDLLAAVRTVRCARLRRPPPGSVRTACRRPSHAPSPARRAPVPRCPRRRPPAAAGLRA